MASERDSVREPTHGIPLEKYIDERLHEVRQAAALAAEVPEAVVSQKEYFDKVVEDVEEYFKAILDEQRRGMVVAEQEREKAAKALRDELARAIEEGDHNLREHIQMQVHQIREALESQEKLDLQRHETNRQETVALDRRIDEVLSTSTTAFTSRLDAVAETAEQHVSQLRRERELVTGAQTEAIAKAEMANEKRFESVNEFRQTLTDQTAQFIRREVFEARMKELDTRAALNSARLDKLAGSDEGTTRAKTGFSTNATLAIGCLGLLIAVLSIVVVVILANAGQ